MATDEDRMYAALESADGEADRRLTLDFLEARRPFDEEIARALARACFAMGAEIYQLRLKLGMVPPEYDTEEKYLTRQAKRREPPRAGPGAPA